MSRLILANPDYQDIDTTLAGDSITLGGTIGKQYYIKNSGTGSNTLTVNYGSDSVDLDDGEMYFFLFDGNFWATLAGGGGGGALSEGFLGETVYAGNVVYFDTDGKIYLADNTDLLTSFVAGIALTSGVLDDKINVQKAGILGLFTGLTVGTDYYLGEAGLLTEVGSLVGGTNNFVYIGRAITTTAIDVNVQVPCDDVYLQDQLDALDVDLQFQINELKAGGLNEPEGSIRYSAVSDEPILLASGWKQFDYNNPVSQATFSVWFAKIGHRYNDAHVAVGDPDLVALDDGTFYPTPPPSSHARVGIPNIDFMETDVSANLLNYAMPSGFRDGTVFRYELLTGTTIVNLVEGTEYFLRRVSSTTMSIHATESEATSNTSPIAISGGSGTFRLTQEGISIADAMQRITGHIEAPRLMQGSDVLDNFIGALSRGTSASLVGAGSDSTGSLTQAIDFDSANSISPYPAKTSDNETRGAGFYIFGYVKVESVLITANSTVSALQYPYQELGRTTWNNLAININHGLGSVDGDTLVKLEVRFSGTNSQWQEIKSIIYDASVGADTHLGAFFQEVDSNNLEFHTGSTGLTTINPTTGNVTGLSNGTSGDFRVRIIKPILTATIAELTDIKEITDAVNVVTTLPDPASVVGTLKYGRYGVGTGKRTFNCPVGCNLVFADGTTSTTVNLVGAGKLTLVPSGDDFWVESYSDMVDTGWVANSDWTNADLLVSHYLNSGIVRLGYKLYFSSDATDANSESVEMDVRGTSAGSQYGASVKQVDNNSFNIKTGDSGIILFSSTGGLNFLGATTAYYYRVVTTISK